jgi:hypothetical protein
MASLEFRSNHYRLLFRLGGKKYHHLGSLLENGRLLRLQSLLSRGECARYRDRWKDQPIKPAGAAPEPAPAGWYSPLHLGRRTAK